MSASPVPSNPASQTDSRSSKKKRSKNESAITVPVVAAVENTANDVSEGFDDVFFRDLNKNLRNTLKKLNATAKVDSILAENPGKSLDELVAEKKINADQKAQALKKPILQAHVTQLEEQIAQYKQFASHYEERLVSQKVALEKAHQEELEAAREKFTAEANAAHKQDFKKHLLVLSQFLRAAATIRRSGDEGSAENRAFEGVLFQVYGGSQDAVDAMLKLIEAADEKVPSVEGELLDVTYANVKSASQQYAPAPQDSTWTEETPATEPVPESDPTLANAGLTELQDPSVVVQASQANGAVEAAASHPEQFSAAPSQTSIGDAANQLAENTWDPQGSTSLSASATADGWVEVPRDPQETETGIDATTASAHATNSWAEDVPSAAPTSANEANDGFEQVVHHQRQNSTRGGRGGRGRGRGDNFRGRGGRGEFRGRARGRGDFRGGRGRGGQAQRSEAANRPAVAASGQ